MHSSSLVPSANQAIFANGKTISSSSSSFSIRKSSPPHQPSISQSHSLEALARMCVSGIVLDPETPVSSISISGMARYTWRSIVHPTSGHRFHGIINQIVKPFALPKEHSSKEVNKATEKPTLGHMHQPSLVYSQRPIPFVTAIKKERSLIKRGLPYLRHSWSRIDMVAIVGFWVAFILSVTGADRAVITDASSAAILVRHIGLFCALSVLRCARLLAVTNGTTVSNFLFDPLPVLTDI